MAKEAIELLWDTISQDPDVHSYLSATGSRWTFIVELSPWMGGIYGRMVQVVKRALRKSIGQTCLSTTELTTVLAEAEAIVNTRPLLYVGDMVDGDDILTPSHFVTMNPRLGMPAISVMDDTDYNEHKARRRLWWKHIELVPLSFPALGKLWQTGYLSSLRERGSYRLPKKRGAVEREPSTGDIVLVKEEKMPRGTWKIGKINKIHWSNDNNVRSATVELPSAKTLRRPLNLLYPMELNINNNGKPMKKTIRQTTVRRTAARYQTTTALQIMISSQSTMTAVQCTAGQKSKQEASGQKEYGTAKTIDCVGFSLV